jgi:hypothetical protein
MKKSAIYKSTIDGILLLTPSFDVLENYLYKKHKNMGDNGISLQVGGGINDPDERKQLFEDLIYIIKANDGFTVERFARNKGYSLAQIEKMVKYYRLTPEGVNPIDELRERLLEKKVPRLIFKMQMSRGGISREIFHNIGSSYEIDYMNMRNFKTALTYAIESYGLKGFALHGIDHLLRTAAVDVINKYLLEHNTTQRDEIFGDMEWEVGLGKKYMEKDGKFGFY